MIIRNAIKSNIRARGRTLLFSALIIALAAMLTLSLGVRLYCSAVIDSADSSFRTVARIEYAGTEYPDSDAADPYAREAAKKVDAEGIASADGVTDYYPASSTAAVVRGLKSNSADSLYRDYAVLRAFKVSKPLYGLTYEPIDGTPEGDFYELRTITDGLTSMVTYVVHQTGREPMEYVHASFYYDYDTESGTYTRRYYYMYYDPDTGKIGYNAVDDYNSLPERCIFTGYIGSTVIRGLKDGELSPEPFLDGSVSGDSDIALYERHIVFSPDGSETLDTYVRAVEGVIGYTVFCDVIYCYSRSGNLLVNVYYDEPGFVLESDKSYYLNGKFVTMNGAALEFELTEFSSDPEVPPYAPGDDTEAEKLFTEYANRYEAINKHVMIESCDSVADLDAFHRGLLYLTDGRFPEKGEEGVCVISGDIASSLAIGVGASLPVADIIGTPENRYEPVSITNDRTLTVVGVTNRSESVSRTIWTTETSDARMMYGYHIGTALLDNAKALSTVETVKSMLPEGVMITVDDQGYANAIKPFQSIGNTASTVFFAASAGTLAVLLLFAYLFIGRQSETVGTLFALGTPKKKIALWMLSGAALIAVLSAAVGASAGFIALPEMIQSVSEKASAESAETVLYSDSFTGIAKTLTVDSFDPDPRIWIACAAIVAVSLALCLLFLMYAVRNSLNRKGKTRVRIPAGKTSVRMRGGLRFAAVSASRGGARTFVVPAVSLSLTVLIILLGSTVDRWKSELDSAYSSKIDGNFVSLNGRSYSQLILPLDKVRAVAQLDGVEDMTVSKSFNYWISGDMPAFSNGELGTQARKSWISSRPQITALDTLSAAKEFYYSSPSIEWLDGFDESFFGIEGLELLAKQVVIETSELPPNSQDGSDESMLFDDDADTDSDDKNETPVYPALVSRTLMEERGYALGDEFYAIYVFPTYTDNENLSTMKLRIVGSYVQTGAKAQIYIPLSAYLKPEWCYSPGSLESVLSGPDSIQRRIAGFLNETASIDTCRFTVGSVKALDLVREELDSIGFSAVNRRGELRQTVLIHDGETLKRIDSLEHSISVGSAVFPVIFVLVAALGFVISWLMINGRKQEFALMRGFGAKRTRVFVSFFTEQAILAFAGCLIGTSALAFFGGGADVAAGVAIFLVCYLAGCALSVLLVGRMKLMALLSNKES